MLKTYGITKNGIYSFGLVGFSFMSVPARIVTDGFVMYRKEIRDERYFIDYSPDNGETWQLALVELDPEEDNIIINIDNWLEGYKDLVRDGAYEIQKELTPTGFDGTEDIDWVVDYYLKPM